MGKREKKKRELNNAIKLAEDPGLLARRVEAALARRQIDSACQMLSRARQLRKAFTRELSASDRDLCARAYVAQAYVRWNKPTEALDSLDRAIELMPERAEFHRLRGNILRRLGRTKLAVAELAEAQRMAPTDPGIGLELLLTRLANGDVGADMGDESSPGKPASDLAQALVAAFRGDLPTSEKAASTSRDPSGGLLHAVLLLAQGQAPRAIPLLEKVVAREHSPGTVRAYAWFYLGVARVQRRELALAVEALEKARALGAPVDQVRTYLGWACQQLAIDAVLGEKLAEAAQWFGRLEKLGGPDALAVSSNAAWALVLHGQAAAKDGDYQGAVGAWSQALATRLRDAALRQNLAIALERAGRTDEAIPHWNYLVRQIPREAKKDAKKDDRQSLPGPTGGDDDEMLKHIRALAHQHLADLYLEQNEVHAAVEQFERALQILPADIEIRRSLATTLIDEGRFGKAIPHLVRIVTAAPGSVGDHVELGLAYLAMGSEETGAEHLEKALALEPEHPVARLTLGKTLAQRVLKSPKASNALVDAQRALDLLPAESAAIGLVARGAAQLAQEDRRAADKTFKEAIKRSADKPDTQVKIGTVYWDMGETKAAIAVWTQAMKEAKKIPCAYADLVQVWAKVGDGPRCEKCLAASLDHSEDEALDAIKSISNSTDAQPFLRQVLHNVLAFTSDPMQQAYLVQGLIYAGDMQGARTLARSLARQAVEEDDDEVLQVVTGLDVKYKFSLLDRSTGEVVQAWIDANPERLW